MKRRYNVRFTGRDFDLFKRLHDYGLLTTRQIEEMVFRDVDSGAVLRRLRQLKRTRYIEREFGVRGGSQIWHLSPYGADRIGSDLVYGKINRNLLPHDLAVVELRLLLEAAGAIAMWRPNHELRQMAAPTKTADKNAGDVIPDGIFAARSRLGQYLTLSLEVELSPKSKRRYWNILEIYSRKKGPFRVWYVVPHERLRHRLFDAWQGPARFCGEPERLMVSDLSDVMAGPRHATFWSVSGEHKLSELISFGDFNAAKQHAHPHAQGVSTRGNLRSSSEHALLVEPKAEFGKKEDLDESSPIGDISGGLGGRDNSKLNPIDVIGRVK